MTESTAFTRPNCALDRGTILCLYVPGFQRQVFKHVTKRQWIPRENFTWFLLINTCNVIFVSTIVLTWILQRAELGSCSGFCKCKYIPQIYADSAHSLWNSLAMCGIRLQFADFTYSFGFHDNLSLLKTYIIIYFWIPQAAPAFLNFIADLQVFVVVSAKLPVFGAIFSNTVI